MKQHRSPVTSGKRKTVGSRRGPKIKHCTSFRNTAPVEGTWAAKLKNLLDAEAEKASSEEAVPQPEHQQYISTFVAPVRFEGDSYLTPLLQALYKDYIFHMLTFYDPDIGQVDRYHTVMEKCARVDRDLLEEEWNITMREIVNNIRGAIVRDGQVMPFWTDMVVDKPLGWLKIEGKAVEAMPVPSASLLEREDLVPSTYSTSEDDLGIVSPNVLNDEDIRAVDSIFKSENDFSSTTTAVDNYNDLMAIGESIPTSPEDRGEDDDITVEQEEVNAEPAMLFPAFVLGPNGYELRLLAILPCGPVNNPSVADIENRVAAVAAADEGDGVQPELEAAFMVEAQVVNSENIQNGGSEADIDSDDELLSEPTDEFPRCCLPIRRINHPEMDSDGDQNDQPGTSRSVYSMESTGAGRFEEDKTNQISSSAPVKEFVPQWMLNNQDSDSD